MIPHRDWHWFGMAGHLCVAHDCLHHLCTQVGNKLISTIGNWRPHHQRTDETLGPMQEIGCDRMFETYVFGIIPGVCSCGCGLPNATAGEIDSLSANSVAQADANHRAMCEKYSTDEGQKKSSWEAIP